MLRSTLIAAAVAVLGVVTTPVVEADGSISFGYSSGRHYGGKPYGHRHGGYGHSRSHRDYYGYPRHRYGRPYVKYRFFYGYPPPYVGVPIYRSPYLPYVGPYRECYIDYDGRRYCYVDR